MLSEEQSSRIIASIEEDKKVEGKQRKLRSKSSEKTNEANSDQRCDFCGRVFESMESPVGSERRKYCSKSCQSRASQGRIKARLSAPPSKRYAARLKFSNPLYFN